MFGIYISGDAGGFLNPAVTFCFCLYRGMPWRRFPIYFVAQLLGGFLGGGVVYGNYIKAIDNFEGVGIRTGKFCKAFIFDDIFHRRRLHQSLKTGCGRTHFWIPSHQTSCYLALQAQSQMNPYKTPSLGRKYCITANLSRQYHQAQQPPEESFVPTLNHF